MVSPPVSEAVNFLPSPFQSGLGYSAMCVARSALCCYLDIQGDDFGQHKHMRRFMKGAFELKPALPKHIHVWDVDLVLSYLENLFPHDRPTLKEMSSKLSALLALLSGQRRQTVHKLNLDDMNLDDSRCVFYITSLFKQSRKGRHLAPIELLAYPSNTKLCIVTVLREYLHGTKNIRKRQRQLLLSYQKPHHPVSNDTLARWVRDTLQRAGVDTLLFSAHSTPSARIC